MKKNNWILFASVLTVSVFAGCSEGNENEGVTPSNGASINFSINSDRSRTIYDESNTYQINWTSGDKVRIYCNEAETVKNADYEVIEPIDETKKNSSTLKANSNGLCWGSEDMHHFFAVYPADNSKVSVTNGVATFKMNQNQVCEVPSSTPTDGNYIAAPDMSNAYMVANISTKPVDKVNLSFKPIMTTLNVTVRGRETQNAGTVTLTGISIVNENVSSTDAQKGQFQYDIEGEAMLASNNISSPTTETTFVRVKQGSNYYLDLEAGQSVTFTVFLPPLPINSANQIKVRVHATGETTQTVTLGGANASTIDIKASAKANIKLPWFPTEQNGNNWITPLDNDIYVSQLSIPGTHDAATKDVDDDILSRSGQCQTRTIAEQLAMGIRCFDLRPTGFNENLPIFHGYITCNINLTDVFDTFNSFLDENPGEFIITIMRWEEEGYWAFHSNSESNFNKYMNTFVGTDRYTKHALPKDKCKKDVTVGEMRGKILTIMRPNQGSNPDAYFTNTAPVGMMFVSGFPGSHANGTRKAYLKNQYVNYGSDQWGSRTDWILYCQNYYEVNNESTVEESVSAKIQSVKTYLDYARDEAANGTNVWVINHCSGYRGGSAIGSAYAQLGQEVNLPIYNYLTDESRMVGSTGIVLLDFVGDRVCQSYTQYTVYGDLLPQTIIDNNYKYRMKRSGE